MKCDVKTSLVQIEKKEMQRLCCEVKETLAADITAPGVKVKKTSFNAANLWSLQKSMKTAGSNWNNKSKTFVVRG